MRLALARFLRGVEQIRTNLAVTEAVIHACRVPLADASDSSESSSAIARIQTVTTSIPELQRAAFSGAVISLYGLTEQFVESLARDAAERLTLIVRTYDQLPDALVKNHTGLTLDALNGIRSGRYTIDLAERDLVAGLQHVLERFTPVRVNSGVYAQHTANVRADVVRQMFERMGIPLAKLASDPGLTAIMTRLFPGEGNMFFVVDDLAQRRNEVAHGADFEALSLDIIRDYLEVIVEFANALLYEVVSFITSSAIALSGTSLGRPDRIYRDGAIAGYVALREAVETGDVIGVLYGSGRARCAAVREVEVQRMTVDRAAAGGSVGLRLSDCISARSRLFILPREFSDLVLPAR